MYINLLRNEIGDLINEIPENERENFIFMQDGAPAHTAIRVQRFLDGRFPGGYIGRGGFLNWPPRSPDLNMLDYFLWGYIKEQLYNHEAIDTEEELIECVNEIVRNITPDMLENVQLAFIRRLRCCILCQGRHFEQYMQ